MYKVSLGKTSFSDGGQERLTQASGERTGVKILNCEMTNCCNV